VIGGTNPGDFAASNNCGGSVAVGTNCTISVTFTPVATGARSANLHIVDNSGNVGATQSVTLTGTGISVATAINAVSVTPNAGSGVTQAFTAVYSDLNGAADFATVRILFNSSLNSTHSCFVTYYPSSNLMYLDNDAATAPLAGVKPGSTSQVSNSQCTLAGTGSSYSTSGNTATLTVELTFSATFTLPQNIYLYASGLSLVNSGWVQVGTWGAPSGPPLLVSVTPSSGSGATQAFTGVYSDPNGAADLATVRVLFNTSVNSTSACYVTYYPSSNLLYLENDGGTGASSLSPGSAGQVSNSQCTLAGTGSSYSTSGNTATLVVALTFSATFTAQEQSIYLFASENNTSKLNSGWVKKGTWGLSSGPPTVVSLTPVSGTGTGPATFTGVFSDPNGAGDFATIQLLFNTTITSKHACYVVYYPSSNLMYLEGDSVTATSAGVTPGSAVQVSNNQCTLSGTGSSYAASGNTGTLAVALTFSATFTGTQNIYVLASEVNGSNSNTGWLKEGTWVP